MALKGDVKTQTINGSMLITLVIAVIDILGYLYVWKDVSEPSCVQIALLMEHFVLHYWQMLPGINEKFTINVNLLNLSLSVITKSGPEHHQKKI